MTEEQPSMATGVTGEQPSMAAATAEEQPSMAAAIAEEQPSMAAATAEEQPTMSKSERTAAIFTLNYNLKELLKESLKPKLLEYILLGGLIQMNYRGRIVFVCVKIYNDDGVKYYVSENNKIYSGYVLTDTKENLQSVPDTIKIGRMFQYDDGTIWKVVKKNVKTDDFDITSIKSGGTFRTSKQKLLEIFAEFIDK